MLKNPITDLTSSIALAGASVVVTRPAGTNNGLLRRIRALGGTAITLPGLRLRAADDAEIARRALLAWHQIDGVIFVSPSAVRYAYMLAPQLQFARTTQVCAIGQATSTALMRKGVKNVLVALERQDSEGLLARPELKEVQGQQWTIVGAPGGRDLLALTLTQRGAQVDQLSVYRREPSRLNQRHFNAVQAADDPLFVLLSSAEVLRQLSCILPSAIWERLLSATAIVSSERLAGIAQTHGFLSIHVARSANSADMIDAVITTLARHRL